MEIACSELSDDAWLDKKIGWSADSGKKVKNGGIDRRHGEFS